MLKEDESIYQCRLLLQHPLAIEDDMRLVSTVELIALRERIHNAVSSFDEPVKDTDFEELKKADASFRTWYATWDQAFSQKYANAGKCSYHRVGIGVIEAQHFCSLLPTESSDTTSSR